MIRFVGTRKSAAVGACFVRSVVDCDEVVAGMVGWFGLAVSVDKGTVGVKSVWFVLLNHSAVAVSQLLKGNNRSGQDTGELRMSTVANLCFVKIYAIFFFLENRNNCHVIKDSNLVTCRACKT